ncbi:MAG: TonB family protein [Polyangiaceae bacterium]
MNRFLRVRAPSGHKSRAPRRGAALLFLAISASVATAPRDTRAAEPAAEAPPDNAPALTLPVLRSDDGAAYPDSAVADGVRETVTVVVIVEIDTQGNVRKANVETPVGHGFDEAATTAAGKLVFTPATRNGKAVAAKFKHTYVFAPPFARIRGTVTKRSSNGGLRGVVVVKAADGTERKVETAADGTFSVDGLPFGRTHVEATADGFVPATFDEDLSPAEEATVVLRLESSAPLPKEAELAPGEEVEEVNVRSRRPAREITRRTLEQRELSRIPGTNGDALRAIQNLPGVARPPAIAGLLIVRGSAPNATNVFVDGTLVPLVYHFGGLSSVVPTEMIEKLDFYPGNFSSQYGRVTGGIVDVGIRDPKKDALHGLAQVDLIDTRLVVEGPVFGTGWNFALAGRRSWIDAWLGPVLRSTGADVTAAPVYYDGQAVLQRDFGKYGNLKFMFYGSDDRLEILTTGGPAAGSLGLHTGFWRAQGQYRAKLSKDTDFRIVSAIGRDIIEFNLGDNFLSVKTIPVTTRAEIGHTLTKGVRANFGMDFYYGPYDVSARLPPPPTPGEPPPGPGLAQPSLESVSSGALYRPALYGEFEVTPRTGTRLVPGVRLDYSKDIQSWNLAPRFVGRQDLTTGYPRTTLKGGVGVFFQPPQPQETDPVFGIPGAKANRAIHYGLGVEREITRQIDVSFEGFYKQLDNYFIQALGNTGSGHAFGLETLIRYKPDSRFFGWIAYTLSRSVLRNSDLAPERLAPFDQTHILTILGSYKLGRGWEIGGRFRLVSGNLTTPQTYGFLDENAGSYLPLQTYPPNSERLPAFHQFDIRVDKTWSFRSWKLATYLDLQNAYNAGNVEGVNYNYNSTKRSYTTGIPILPSLGLRGEF